MNLWKDIPVGPDVPLVVNAVVEIPKGSRNKYEYDKEKEAFAVDRVLYSPMHYPAEYGIIPKTLWDDGDPMDIMVVMRESTFPGCVIETRVIGLMKMIDGDESDDKVIGVPVNDPAFRDVNDIHDMPEAFLDEVAQFFTEYKRLQQKSTEVLGWENAKKAFEAIEHSIELYNDEYLETSK